jgi:hypothetical protein
LGEAGKELVGYWQPQAAGRQVRQTVKLRHGRAQGIVCYFRTYSTAVAPQQEQQQVQCTPLLKAITLLNMLLLLLSASASAMRVD